MIASPDLWKKSILHSTVMPLNVISVGLVTNFSTFHWFSLITHRAGCITLILHLVVRNNHLIITYNKQSPSVSQRCNNSRFRVWFQGRVVVNWWKSFNLMLTVYSSAESNKEQLYFWFCVRWWRWISSSVLTIRITSVGVGGEVGAAILQFTNFKTEYIIALEAREKYNSYSV